MTVFSVTVLRCGWHAGHPFVALAVEVKKAERHATRQLWLFRPNNHIGAMFTEAGVKEHHIKVSEAEAKRHWTFWHNYLEKGCAHGKSCSRYILACLSPHRQALLKLMPFQSKKICIAWVPYSSQSGAFLYSNGLVLQPAP